MNTNGSCWGLWWTVCDFRREQLCKCKVKTTKVWSISIYFLEVKCDNKNKRLYNIGEMSIYTYKQTCFKCIFPGWVTEDIVLTLRSFTVAVWSCLLSSVAQPVTAMIVSVELRFSSRRSAVGAVESQCSQLPLSALPFFCRRLNSLFPGTQPARFWHALSLKTFWVCEAPGLGSSRPSPEDTWRWRDVREVVAQDKGRQQHGTPDFARAPDWWRPEGDRLKNVLVFSRSNALRLVRAPGYLWRWCSCLCCEHIEGIVKTLKSHIVLQSFLYLTRPREKRIPPLQWRSAPWWPGTGLLAAVTCHLMSCTPSRGS